MTNTFEPYTITWDALGGEAAESVKRLENGNVLDLGRKIHGHPVVAYDGTVLWIESFQWMIQTDGSREPRRYRLMGRTDAPGLVKGPNGQWVKNGKVTLSFPFDQAGRVMEFDTEQGARDLLVKRAEGRI